MAQGPYQDHQQGLTQAEIVAAVLSALWIIGIGVFFWYQPENAALTAGLRRLLMLLAMVLPVAIVGVAIATARSARYAMAQTYQTRAALDQLRQTYLAGQAIARPAADAFVPQAAQKPTPSPAPASQPAPSEAPQRFASRREVSRLIVPRATPQTPADQPALAFATSPDDENPPLERSDMIRALNFPDNENDTEGFAALRRALRDRGARHLVQASQDVLTLLSQDGIYMDDLRPEPASADLWRRFAKGERGRSLDALGAVRDQAALSLVAARMREDTIFRDAVHHFMRRFDLILVTFEEQATDTDLLELAETRTARAFMLLGRASRTFD